MMKRLFTMLLCFLFAVPLCVMTADAATDYRITQESVVSPAPIRDGYAGIIFSDVPQMTGMSFEDGIDKDRYDITYSQQVTYKDIPCREVFVENYFYMKMDRAFAAESDSVFELTIDYWDYGGGGSFHVEYTTDTAGNYKRITIPKLGLDENNQKTAGTWFRATVYIDDACFTGSMDYDSDFRIISNAYNAFSRIEVRNVSRTAGETEDFGVFNGRRANVLHFLGMFDGYGEGEEFDPCLDKKLTREEFIVQMLKSYNLKEEALKENLHSGYTDVSAEAEPYIGLAKKMGITEQKAALGAGEHITQREMFVYYLRLIGAEDENLYENAFTLAEKYGLNSAGSMIFQPEKEVTVDAFVVPALLAFSKDNLKNGKSPFKTLFEQGVYDQSTILEANDDSLTGWLLSTEFYIQQKTIQDEYSGRTWHKIDFLGQSALKEYYTQNCMSQDCTRLYFRDESLRLFEYELATGKTKYIDNLLRDYNYMVTPKNNLWYTNDKWEIVKMSLTDYKKEVMGKIPDWQTSKPFMMQVNNAETRISYEWFDTKGDFDANYRSRIPIYNLETGEWDLRFSYGFDTEWYRPNHQCINPKYDNYAFFAHEGNAPDGGPQPDRVWVVNMDTNEYYNVFKQKRYSETYVGESAVHEAWSNSGEWLMCVKNVDAVDGLTRGVGVGGAVMMRPDGTDKRYIPANYRFTWNNGGIGDTINHCMLSNTTDRWLVGDSRYGRGWVDVYLIDTWTGASYHLARTVQTGANPGHTHPQFSPDDQTVIFGLWSDDKKRVEIGWMDVSDIVNQPLTGGKYDISDTCDTFGYQGFNHYIEPRKDAEGNINSFLIPGGNEMYVNVKRELIEKDNTPADVTITYLDKGYNKICISYLTWNQNVGGIGRLTERKQYIQCTGTGKVQSKTLHFDDICLGNMDILGTDFRISGTGVDSVIYSVDVAIPQK